MGWKTTLASISMILALLSMTAFAQTPYVKLVAENSFNVNAANGGTVHVSPPSTIPIPSVTIVVPPGTYANINGKMESNYSLAILLFNSVSFPPPPVSGEAPSGAFAVAVNGYIVNTATFTTSSGSPAYVEAYATANARNTTSWTVQNGTFNTTAYVGGQYVSADQWTQHNATTMEDSAVGSALLHIFVMSTTGATITTSVPTTTVPTTTIASTIASTTVPVGANTNTTSQQSTSSLQNTTTAPTTIAQPSQSSATGSSALYAGVIIVIIIIVVAAYLLTKKK